MSARCTRLWVLITDGVSTRICSSQDGKATPISAPSLQRQGSGLDDRDVVAWAAWFKAEGHRRLSENPRRQHVLHVCQVLLEAARERAYDGLVIIAPAEIADRLEDALSAETRALLIGRIVRDSACLNPEVPCEQPEIRH